MYQLSGPSYLARLKSQDTEPLASYHLGQLPSLKLPGLATWDQALVPCPAAWPSLSRQKRQAYRPIGRGKQPESQIQNGQSGQADFRPCFSFFFVLPSI